MRFDPYPQVDVVIPDLPKLLKPGHVAGDPDAYYVHHPISRGQQPVEYRPAELHDRGEAHTPWLNFFETMLVGLRWHLKTIVPYAFRTRDGLVRSLDAGCLKFLSNRTPREVDFNCGPGGYISSVDPRPVLLKRHRPNKAAILQALLDGVL